MSKALIAQGRVTVWKDAEGVEIYVDQVRFLDILWQLPHDSIPRDDYTAVTDFGRLNINIACLPISVKTDGEAI